MTFIDRGCSSFSDADFSSCFSDILAQNMPVAPRTVDPRHAQLAAARGRPLEDVPQLDAQRQKLRRSDEAFLTANATRLKTVGQVKAFHEGASIAGHPLGYLLALELAYRDDLKALKASGEIHRSLDEVKAAALNHADDMAFDVYLVIDAAVGDMKRRNRENQQILHAEMRFLLQQMKMRPEGRI
jgi:hypothetical protein